MSDTGMIDQASNLLGNDTKPETEVEYQTIMESRIESQDWIQELSKFELQKEGVVLNKTTTYKLQNDTTHFIESETSKNFNNVVDQDEGNRSKCYSCFTTLFDCCVDTKSNPQCLIYKSPTFQSKAMIKLPGENDPSWKNISYFQFSKILFEKHYGKDKHVLQYSPTDPNREKWTLDSVGDADPAYSRAGTQEISFTSKEIKIKLVDQPLSWIESHNYESKLTRVVRNQDFLVFLVLDIDGSYKVLHSLKWRTEFEWLEDHPEYPHHRWMILPNKEDIPHFDPTFGNCNTNQNWYLNGTVLLIQETPSEPDEMK